MTAGRRSAIRVADAVRFRHIPKRLVWLSLYAALNFGLALYFVRFGEQGDWSLWASLPEALARGELYEQDSNLPFVWSPLAGWLMAGVTLLGYWTWAALHVVAVLLLRDGRLYLLTFLSWPFWHDVAEGNTMTFVFVAGVLALRGSRGAALAYLALCLLMPRPVQGPLALWLLWKAPSMRLPALGLVVVNAVAVLASGYAADWLAAMTEYGIGGAAVQVHTIGPPRWLGSAWLIIGIPAGLWLTVKGRVGFAGLAFSPYWLPIYLLVALWEVVIGRAASLSGFSDQRDPMGPRR